MLSRVETASYLDTNSCFDTDELLGILVTHSYIEGPLRCLLTHLHIDFKGAIEMFGNTLI